MRKEIAKIRIFIKEETLTFIAIILCISYILLFTIVVLKIILD